MEEVNAVNLDTDRHVRDGGTGEHVASDARAAAKTVPFAARKRAYFMLGAAGVTIAFILLTRLLWLFEPLLDMIYAGLLTDFLYYVIVGVFCIAYIIGLNAFVKRYCGLRLFVPKKQTLSIWRLLSIVGVAALFVFISSAIFKFTLKVQMEMGLTNMADALTNMSVYLYHGFHMWLGFTAASLVQYAASTLLPTKYTIPWGSIFLVTVYGLIELIFERFTTVHTYSELYYLFTYAYAIIFTLSSRSYHVSYWASIAVMVL